MSVDRFVYCLERLSDYREFERLCSALLAGAGYPRIEPLGGTGDEGRDAIIRNDSAGRPIVFAYTVRSDWRAKLKQDCKRVREKEHNPHSFVFVCNEALSASDKDWAHKYVDSFGWTLDLFDLERLRAQLLGPQHHLVAQHPAIFAPPFFPQRGGQSLSDSKDTLLLDHHDADHALASWISRRLSLNGYRTWSRGTAPLAGENSDETVRLLMEARAVQYLPILSETSLADTLFLERCALAAAKSDFVLPCAVTHAQAGVPSRLKSVLPADFSQSLKDGMAQVLRRLSGLGIQPDLEPERGRHIALRDYLPARVTVDKPEPIFANLFPLQLPASMLLYDLQRALSPTEVAALGKQWAFVEMNNYRLASFAPAPARALPVRKAERTPEFSWTDVSHKDGKRTEDLAKELARRSLEVACYQKGLELCPDRDVLYYPQRKHQDWNQSIKHVDGRPTTVQLTGTRTKGWGERASQFRYHLAPLFRPQHDHDGSWNVAVRIYVRCTDMDGQGYEGKEINRRRKVVTKSWWNKEWLARLLGVVQALETKDGFIEVGAGTRSVVMSTAPLRWDCPVGLDVQSLAGMPDIGEEIAACRERVDGEEDDDSPAVREKVQK
jgi:hypothetical protein